MFQLAGGYISTVAQSAFKKFLETDYQALDANIILNKWDKDVEARLKDIVAKNRITEIAAYNELLIAWLLENSPRDITEERGLNLARYLDLLPNEPALDFWKKWNKVDKVASEKWYKMKSLRNEFNHKIILSVSVNPILYKKNQAAAAAK